MNYFKTVVLLTLVPALIINCSDTTGSINPAAPSDMMSTLQINLTDAPRTYDQVNITFSEISVKFGNEWKIISSETQTLDLLTLTNGRTALLEESEVEAGTYTQIRLKISDAEVISEGNAFSLTVPSGAQSGLKFGPAFTLEPGATTRLTVDFDADRSIHPTGPPGNPNGFILSPVIRIVPGETSGTITGRVTNFEHLPIAYAIAESDTVTSAHADSLTGDFLLSFLPEGTYTVSVTDTSGLSFSGSDISVAAGQTTDLGELTLQ